MKDAMVGRKHSIITYAVFLSLYVLLLPFSAADYSNPGAQNSIYNGYLTAVWTKENCRIEYNSIGGYVLTFGPYQGTMNRDPYYLSLLTSENTNFSASMETSDFSDGLQRKWWNVSAYLESAGYIINGSLVDTEDIDKSHNYFNGTSNNTGSDTCEDGTVDFLWYHHKNQALFRGNINSSDVDITMSGAFFNGTDSSTRINYAFRFVGSWVKDSAVLNMKEEQPTWTNSTIWLKTDTNKSPTIGTSTWSSQNDSRRLGQGAVAGITVGAVCFVIIACAIGSWWFTNRQNRKEEVQVYPQLAYLYTPSPSPVPSHDTHERGQEYSSSSLAHCRTAYGPAEQQDLESREVFIQDDTLPIEVQHQWRIF
ncbi:hypothetical protein RUND412_003195 [Rhizina undulata]